MNDDRAAWERLARSVANHGIVTRRSERPKPTRLYRLKAWGWRWVRRLMSALRLASVVMLLSLLGCPTLSPQSPLPFMRASVLADGDGEWLSIDPKDWACDPDHWAARSLDCRRCVALRETTIEFPDGRAPAVVAPGHVLEFACAVQIASLGTGRLAR